MAAGSVNVTGLLSTQAAPMQYNYSGCGESSIDSFLRVDLNNPDSPYNQTSLFEGNRGDFKSVPPGLGAADNDRIIALREVFFVSSNRVMVKVTELSPNSGRVYYNHYNLNSWDGWYSPGQDTPRQNMLINPTFTDPINQRGQTQYTGEIYGIDCWKGTWTGNGVLSLVNPGTADGCVSLFRSGYQAHMTQLIENSKELAGKTVTLSALMKNDAGGISGISLQGKTSSGSDFSQIRGVGKNSEAYTLLSITETVPANTVGLFADLTSANSVKSYAKAAKLELGTQQTLAHQDANGNWVLNDPPPDKTLELLKCKRYYQRYGSGLTCLVHTANEVLFTLPFPVKMRTTPTVKLLSDTIQLYDPVKAAPTTLTGASISISAVTERSMGSVVVQGTFSSAPTKGTVLRMNRDPDILELSAEL